MVIASLISQAEFELELVEGSLDFVRLAAVLVDVGDALLEVHAGLDRAQHFVAGAEDAFEELELLGQQLEDALVGGVLAVEEVDDHHVVLLAVAMAAADALLDALRIPGQVVVHHSEQNWRLMPSAPASVAIMMRPCSRK